MTNQSKFDSTTIIVEITPDIMAGETPLLRALNAYLTKSFVFSSNIPVSCIDECLSESYHIVEVADKIRDTRLLEVNIADYLNSQFRAGPDYPLDCSSAAVDVLKIMSAHGCIH